MLLLTLMGLAACAAQAPAPAPAPVHAQHLVIVTVDTLRADHVGCYGYAAAATPNLDALARDGAQALDARVPVPLTRPSHASLFSGLLPAEHGIRDNVSPALAAGVPLLAEVLHGAGFKTAGFVSSIVLSAQSGLARGFDTYSAKFDAGADDARFLNTIQRRGDAPTAEAIAWLESRPGPSSFLWLHLYDPHDPYEPPEPYASRFAEHPYDGEIAYVDELVGRLDGALQRLGRRNNTLLLVTSDHGEGLGEHGEAVHGFFVYDSTLRVPQLWRGPGVSAGTRLRASVSPLDVFPSVLDLLGVARPASLKLSGRSLARALLGQEQLAEIPAYAESLLPLLHYGWSDLRTLKDGRWKYIQAPRPELYDLVDDPGERKDLALQQVGRAEALRAALAKRLQAEAPAARQDGAGVPADLIEKLGALGYLGAGAALPGATTGADPKDKLEEYKLVNTLVREGLVRLRQKDFAGSAERFRKLLARGVESFEVHYYLARALVGLKRQREAAGHFEAALRHLPGYAAAYLGLAQAREAAGDPKAALAALTQGEAKCPRDAALPAAEAQLRRRLRQPRQAAEAYDRALALLPRDALLRVEAAELLRDLGETARAITLLREAIALDPQPASYWNSLGMVLGGSGDLTGAEAAFREARRRTPGDAEYAYNLGLALLRQGRKDEARVCFKQALASDPAFSAARQRLAEEDQ